MKPLRPHTALTAVLFLTVFASQAKETVQNTWRDEGWGKTRTVVVSPGNLHGWVFSTNEEQEGLVDLPVAAGSRAPGMGDLMLGVQDSTQRSLFATGSCAGVRLDELTALKFDLRRSTPVSGNAAPVLQFDVDFDLRDSVRSSAQGKLIYDPALNGAVTPGTWQTWDALAGKWYMTGTAFAAGAGAGQPFPQTAPATLAQIRAQFPNAGFRTAGNLAFKAGGDRGAFTAEVDFVVIGHHAGITTWNFEPDSDGDTVPDLYDRFPNSDLRDMVNVGTGSTSVINRVATDGATIQDEVNQIGAGVTDHRKYAKSIASLAGNLQKSGMITKEQNQILKNAAEISSVGNPSAGYTIYGLIVAAPPPVRPIFFPLEHLDQTLGAVAMSGGTLDINNAGLRQNVFGSISVTSLSGTGGTITDSATSHGFVVNQAANTTFGGAITNSLGLTKSGSGVLTLNGANTYSGTTTVTGGTLVMTGATPRLNSLNVSEGAAFVFAGPGTLKLQGYLNNWGTLRVTNGATLDLTGVSDFGNFGVLDLIGGTAILPPGFANRPGGIVLDSGSVKVKTAVLNGNTFTLTIDGFAGHTYQLQRSTGLNEGFTNTGAPQTGVTGTVLTFTSQEDDTAPHGFYRIAVDL
jgi:autotransporter-associated beta strand protein